MNFALILAGGTGQRMGNAQTPKQFLVINNKAILLHTLEKFYLFKEELEKIIVATHPSWVAYTRDLVLKNFLDAVNIFEIVAGGSSRHDTIISGIEYINRKYELTSSDIVLTHDAVRPFISYKIIRDNIDQTMKYGAVDTVIESIDTIVCSKDGIQISDIPSRAHFYQGQTPQSFYVKELLETYQGVSQSQLDSATDIAKLYRLLDKPVYLVKGEQINFKITTPFDLSIARALLEGDDKGD